MYRPMEFFASDLIYEGLVAFEPVVAPSGDEVLQTVPALATSWTSTPNGVGGMTITFQLRSGVTFHDGQPWNAAAALKNLDNVFAPPLATADWHGWYELPLRMTSWRAPSAMSLEITMNAPYSATLQDLTFIRPLRFLSPASFPDVRWPGTNSCRRQWGNVTGPGGAVVMCAGILAPSGTGPFSFAKKTTNQREIGPSVVSLPEGSLRPGESVTSVSFASNTAYWRGAPAIAGVECMVYTSTAAVATALHNGMLEIAYGVNSVDVSDFLSIRANHSVLWSAHTGGPINTRLVAINSNASITSSLSVRRAIVALIDRGKLVSGPLGGLERTATTVFPVDLPFCNVPLTPVPAYDPEKAALLLSADGWTSGSNGIRAKSGQVLSVKMVTLDCESPHPHTSPPHTLPRLYCLTMRSFTPTAPTPSAPNMIAMASIVVQDLRSAGFDASLVSLPKSEYNTAATRGNFSLIFTETWGNPYDPHTTAAAWRVPNEADFAAQLGMAAPMTKAQLDGNISAALVAPAPQLAHLWTAILSGLHANAIYAPISSVVNLAIVSKEIAGFRMGVQQFDLALALRSIRLVGTTPTGTSTPIDRNGVIAASVLAPIAALMALGVLYMVRRERAGKPLFTPLMQEEAQAAVSPAVDKI